MSSYIRVIGASQHNLKHISFDLPLNTLTVITGVSGAGKSSLAYDVLYAEGQRRYVETFSPYARQFMERMDRPAVEKIEGILPAIAIDQRQTVKTSRSTVGTMTEMTDFVKLLFVHLAVLYCPHCGRPVTKDTPQKIAKTLLTNALGKRGIVFFPSILTLEKKKELQRLGFDRIWEKGEIKNIEEVDFKETEQVYVVVDRLIIEPKNQARLLEAIEMAMNFGQGEVAIQIIPEKMLKFSRNYACPYCGIKYRLPLPNFFSFNSPLGACETCKGFGRVIDYDLDLVIPDKNKSLADGAIKIWKKGSYEYQDLISFCNSRGIPTDIPFCQLSPKAQKDIIQGGHGFYGIKGFFRWLETKIYKMHVRVFLSRYRGYFTCPDCGGTRFKKEVLFYRLKGKNIAQIYAMTIDEAYEFFSQSFPEGEHDPAVKLLLNEITHRLHYLKEAGVGYLTLDRQSRTLSGGEVARVNLTRASGSSLVNMLFVLDEPTVGLHPRDNKRLIKILKDLSKENTVVVVEHDPDIIKAADYILDLGPGAGEDGGKIVYFGKLNGLLKANKSITGKYISGKKQISLSFKKRKPRRWLEIKGAAAHNLKNINVCIPLGVMVCLTGVSGAGKSTLAYEIIYKGIKKEKGDFRGVPGKYHKIVGLEYIDDVILIDQTPIGKTPRANPATYLGIFSAIRNFFASLPEAKLKGYTPGTFSFNSPGGRCKVCQGAGFERIEMQFLSDVYLTCPACKGQRYQPEILEITYKGKNIADVLNMTFKQSMKFFAEHPKIREQFLPLIDIGLDYLRLGQPINTLSAGEAQRLKLAKYFKMDKEPCLFIFDEPTVGLHLAEIEYLLKSLENLLNKGHSLIVIEHNLEVIKSADYVIDLGPEGGPEGGEIVASGTPEEIVRIERSYTGQCLRKSLMCNY
ncbi:MAG TPA: excinuclease ABC subunit A [Candidatus Desulfofervidus auxilii]|uniref:UvrABC system protein A n=1 Tax=Desulfofervidus auxilii TaxID=1621989 RepID=A0A7V1I4L7_DESA2|nr:excinuclease ABC subunit A [Candidatus Desulfofervidus auxilii]